MKFRLLAASALAAAVYSPTSSLAQTTANDPAPKVGPSQAIITASETAETEAGETIIVTGSRIRRPNLESTVPITSLAGAEFFETGAVAIGDTLNDLPQLRSTFSQQNSTRGLGVRGLNLLDLRGLGTQRTLVLVNGRRHVGGDLLNNAVSPDTNTFPTDLIERVDIVTGGNSSIYGSDAIAGVVNFILKDKFDGIQVRGQGGISQYGDAGNQYISGLFGKNFAEGRGNVAVNVEYANSERYFGSGRPNLRQNNAFIVVGSDPAGSPNGAAGGPDRTFFRDIRSATISPGGQTGVFYGRAAPGCGGVDATGGAYVCNSLFQPDGTLVPQTGTRIGLAPNGNYTGGNGQTGRDGQLLTLSPSLERISVNLIGHFEVSPAFVPFVEAKYVRSDAFGSQSGPFFAQGTTLGGDARERPRLDNPYLSTQARTQLTPQLLASTVNANTGAAFAQARDAAGNPTGLTPAEQLAAQRAAINAGTFRFNLRRNYVDLGIRDELFRRETYRAVGGVRGDFNEDWNYEVALNYGEHREKNRITSNVNRQRFVLATDTTRDAAGNIVCRSRVDPGAAGTDLAGNPAILAADVAACVPLNPFGAGNISPEARQYLTLATRASGKITQFDASGYVSGDLSQLFELPGGPIGFSIGGEYRRERNSYDLDDLTQAGYAFYNAIPTFRAPAFEVKELFGEISIPLLKDKPFFKELTLTGSGRVSDYKGSTGTVYTYAGGVDWKPIDDIRFRGTYSRAIRAPNLSELFAEQGQNFAAAPNDPCSARFIGAGSETRAANCAAAGIPASYDFVYTSSIEIITGGNPDLKEEKSTSWTAGGVLTPTFLPGLSISADYYDIKVDDVITSVTAQDILDNCYDAASLDNPFCSLFTRNGNATGSRGEVAFQVLQQSLLQSSLNFAKLTARGIDTEIAYRRTFDWGSAGFRANWTHVLERTDFTDPGDPGRGDRILSELGDPKNQVNFSGDVTFGKFTVGYQVRWIDKMYVNQYEDFNSFQGRPPENADYAEISQYPSVFYHDARIAMDVTEKLNVYGGVDNIGNRQPPYGLTGVGEFSGIYDVRGRYAYIGAIAKF